MKTKDAMIGRWVSALRDYGLTDQQLSGKHCPCPICGGHDRFRFDNLEDRGTWFCSQCGSGDGIKLLLSVTGKDFKTLAAELDKSIGNYKADSKPAPVSSEPMLQRIGNGLQRLGDIDPVTVYLRSRSIRKIPREHLRFNPSVFHWGEGRTMPAMVAAMRDVSGRVLGYHLTFLQASGEKAAIEAPRLYTKGKTGECVIRLSEVCEHIGLAEGIETALSVTELYGLPCWATGDAARLAKFLPPEGVKQVTIFADVDHNFTGEAAAFALAQRLIREGLTCEVRQECPRGSDYNDLLRKEA